MIPYIVYTSIITAICFLFYRLLLHRETFFGLNRWFFLCCLLGSFALPLVHVPGGWSLRTQVIAKLKPSDTNLRTADVSRTAPELSVGPDPSGTTLQDIITAPSRRISKEAVSFSAAASARVTQSASPVINPISTTAPREEKGSPVNLTQILKWLYYIYLSGALIFGSILLLQIIVLIYQVVNNPVVREGLFRIVQTKGNRAPCSFGHYIFINPALYDEETFLQILSHEKIHVQQRHSFDIMFAELCIIVQWFNPFAWFYRKALEDNLEFLTDAAMIGDPKTNASHYQMSLVRVAAPYLPLSITSNYNQSLLKKRMIMMHIQKSSVRTTWKYLFLLPLLTGMVCIFNDTAAVSQNVNLPKTQQQTVKPVPGTAGHSLPPAVDSTRSGGEPEPAANLSGSPKLKLNPSGDDADIDASVNVNPVNSVSIHTTVNPIVHTDPTVNVNVETNVNPVVVVAPLNVNSNIAQPDQRKGTWMASIRGDTVELTLRSEQGEGYREYSTNSETMKKSEFSSLPTGQKGDFTVTREAGILSLNGVFDGDEGFGHYSFKENTEFQNYLDKAGITGLSEKRMFGVFFANVTKAYVEEIAQAGYPHMTVNNLIGMSSMQIKAPFIQSWKQLGYSDLEPHDLIALKSMNIEGTYLKEMQNAGFKDIPLHDLVAAKSVGIDAAYVQTWKQAGFTDFAMREIISAKSVGVDPAYVQSWKQAGFADLSIRDLISAKSVGIDPAYVQSWKTVGFTDLTIRELVSAKSVGIDPAYLQGWKQAGYNDLSIHDLISAKSVGIDPAYLESWKQAGFTELSFRDLVSAKSMKMNAAYAQTWTQAGYKDFSIRDLISLKSQGIDGSYVQSWKTLGYSDLPVHDLVALKSVGVDGNYLKEMEAAGYSHLEAHELVAFKSEGVTPGFVKGFQTLGFKDIPTHTIMQMRSMGLTPDYITAMRNKGFNSNDLQEYIKLKTFR